VCSSDLMKNHRSGGVIMRFKCIAAGIVVLAVVGVWQVRSGAKRIWLSS